MYQLLKNIVCGSLLVLVLFAQYACNDSSAAKSSAEPQNTTPTPTDGATAPETLAEIAGHYSYSYSDYGSYNCSNSFCSKTDTFESATLIIDKYQNFIYCYEIQTKSTGAYYYGEGAFDSWANEDVGSSSECQIGYYELLSESDDGAYTLELNFENTDFTTDSYGSITDSQEIEIALGQTTIDSFIATKQSAEISDDESYYDELQAIIKNGVIVRYYTAENLKGVDISGTYYSQEIFADNTDSDESVYTWIDDNYLSEDLFQYLVINDDQTYQSCTIIDQDIYAHAGTWEITDDAEVVFDSNRLSYTLLENAESTNTMLFGYYGVTSFSLPGYSIDIDDLARIDWSDLSSNEEESVQVCLDYLQSDSAEKLALNDEEQQEENFSSMQAKLVGTFFANSDSSFYVLDGDSPSYYDEYLDEDVYASELYDAPQAALSISENGQYQVCLQYAGSTYHETGSLALTTEAYNNRDFDYDYNYEEDGEIIIVSPEQSSNNTNFIEATQWEVHYWDNYTNSIVLRNINFNFTANVFDEPFDDIAIFYEDEDGLAESLLQTCFD